ncbi:DUF1294 domain-containing protein [Vibrio sp. S11_S32]|uniref:DUF1294 domain-containing protein n=1 Tax=Vibrio sp. S11_S32 TaxID=2720225 RepID=UPI0016815262|nr:DUF1294 domain-containing protein [Vibrio sp. S11_S32]MBD1577128.1 DUF1294 domain-containing protein [Vibrio sp. S11_S32]
MITLQTGLLYCFIMSLVTFIVYWKDKRAARKDLWRTPEKTLHILAFAGGWPGALIAQKVFRHKTRKLSFQIIFLLMVTLNCIGTLWIQNPNFYLN